MLTDYFYYRYFYIQHLQNVSYLQDVEILFAYNIPHT